MRGSLGQNVLSVREKAVGKEVFTIPVEGFGFVW